MEQEQISKTKKIQMSKNKFRIGELAKDLQVKKFVIRFWEKEFGLKSDRSQGGQRYYTHDDFNAFKAVKLLLYKQGFTIAGAKIQLEKMLQQHKGKLPNDPKWTNETAPLTAAVKTNIMPETTQKTFSQPIKKIPYIPKEFLNQVKTFKEKLLQFKKTLG